MPVRFITIISDVTLNHPYIQKQSCEVLTELYAVPKTFIIGLPLCSFLSKFK